MLFNSEDAYAYVEAERYREETERKFEEIMKILAEVRTRMGARYSFHFIDKSHIETFLNCPKTHGRMDAKFLTLKPLKSVKLSIAFLSKLRNSFVS